MKYKKSFFKIGQKFSFQENGIALLAREATVKKITEKSITFEYMEDRSLSRAIICDQIKDKVKKVTKKFKFYGDEFVTFNGLMHKSYLD